jgi:predicted transcriptional regulator
MGVDTKDIELSSEQKERLAELAERTGRSWSDVFDYCIRHDALSSDAQALQEETGGYIEDPKLWQAQFDDWMSRQRSRNPNVDDSRESIYPDRS